MILYHYPISPFSEKIRLMLNYTGLAWRARSVPPMPPRKQLDGFIGGYRRIPVLQIGTDFFCDTRLIVDEIASRYGADSLSYSRCDGAIRQFVERTNTQIFLAVAQTAQASAILPTLMRQYWPWQVFSLIRDRAGIGKTSLVEKVSSAERQARLTQWQNELEERLSQQAFLFGDRPSLADFSAYHTVWFADRTRKGHFLSPSSAAGKWQARMRAYTADKVKTIGWDAIETELVTARPTRFGDQNSDQQSAAQQRSGPVKIGPSDYALDTVTGELVYEDDVRWVISRVAENGQTVQVHFPKIGFQIETPSKH